MFVAMGPRQFSTTVAPDFKYLLFCLQSSFSTGRVWLTILGNKGCNKPQLSTLRTSSHEFQNQLRYLSGRKGFALALFWLRYLGHLAESRFSF